MLSNDLVETFSKVYEPPLLIVVSIIIVLLNICAVSHRIWATSDI